MSGNAIEVRNAAFRYRGNGFCLHVPELDIAKGETAAVIGPSGSGKTTLLNLVAGCWMLDAGSVRVGGTDIAGMSDGERRAFRIEHIGMVFQEFELLEYLSVMDNILLPYRISPAMDLASAVRDRACDLASTAGIVDKLNRRADELSQGERQRVAVCRALVTQPSMLLCDEPTGNLDPENTQKVLDMIMGYAKAKEATVVSVTHEHDLLQRFSRTIDITSIQNPDSRIENPVSSIQHPAPSTQEPAS